MHEHKIWPKRRKREREREREREIERERESRGPKQSYIKRQEFY